jgi:hypothetical protein
MAVGEIVHEFDQFVREVTLKTNTGCTKGDVGAYDTDGFAQAGATSKKPFVVFRETVAAPGSGKQAKAKAVVRGCVTVNKGSNAIAELQLVKVIAAGKVDAYAPMDAPASYVEADMQTELDKLEQVVGQALKAAAATRVRQRHYQKNLRVREGHWHTETCRERHASST